MLVCIFFSSGAPVELCKTSSPKLKGVDKRNLSHTDFGKPSALIYFSGTNSRQCTTLQKNIPLFFAKKLHGSVAAQKQQLHKLEQTLPKLQMKVSQVRKRE